MKRQTSETQMMEDAFMDEPIDTCKNCRNVYKDLWLKVGGGWNDFGFRYCPFCGTETEEFAHIC